VLVSQQPSDELRTDVLVNLFALTRRQPQNLEGPVCALAALPLTPHLQEALYNTDPLPSLTRNLAEILSDPKLAQNSTVAQAYLTVLLSLVQTTHSSLNWTANTLIPFLEPGGSLSALESYSGEILELVMCIYVHVYARSEFPLPQNFTSMILTVISNCTNPFHHRFLVEASLYLSVMDKGAALEKLVLDGAVYIYFLEGWANGDKWIDENRMITSDLNLNLIFSHMIRHPQKQVQKAALTAISGLCAHGKPSTHLF